MARDLSRALLQRYPALRSSWPVEQARTWRARKQWREQPRRMASWFRDALDMHTRVCISNLEVPEAPTLCQPVTVLVSLFDEDGGPLASRRFDLGRNASQMIELAELLPAA